MNFTLKMLNFAGMRFITADIIYPINSAPLKNKVIVVNENGRIEDIVDDTAADTANIERFKGSICPGFVNTHCHLELSYMKGRIESGGGLHHFIKEVEKIKRPADDEILQGIKDADKEMYRNGIVAVGDICNTANSFAFKETSKIYYHNFIEVYAFDESRADAAFERGLKLQSELPNKERSSVTPHAPYSASKKLLQLFSAYAQKNNSILSIHNQETEEEDLFFREKKGNILDRLNYFGIDTSNWPAPGRSSLQYTLPQLPATNKILLVHNTFTPAEDILFANTCNKNLFWCFCPNANLYIEDRLPNVHLFLQNNCSITLGTDSYASNWSLGILDEIRSLKKHFPELSLEELLKWSTLNGAKFLGMEEKFGSIEKNKEPGLNLISPDLKRVEKLV
ncbi:MAG TPA: amidohydrolase family protein [Bacteroidia bacterium]|jgi:cytosine/adenosine deaminase-related metal-dependent hydrolase|nr:amidohydrolase family protein [Bacteroidia bacterium]